ncbi:MAG: OmpA family protein [Hymenobacteraceae bacterium]|nr:OmpA family protein [Hymenobacteraceae bacterium]MDX5398030.1 OmpA family protein [Hymenobacteraceae bacterium]MDX5442390.1 OmpA family protein [Hymenobacteraceae bacterium]MDX5514101.1 OmpA family protein [Hymenobacteraceae bacterium]
MKKIILPVALLLSLNACVSSKKYKTQAEELNSLKAQLQNCNTEKQVQAARISSMESEIETMKANTTSLLNQLSNFSVVTEQQAANIRKSLENIQAKDEYIQNLQISLQKKDSLNMALVMNLKGALQNVNDEDVQIKVDGSAVFISISDKMLFKSGSYEITPRAKEVLGKVAKVIQAQPELKFMVEGHTDTQPIRTNFIKDNWDLSVLRATAVVRTLQKDYGMDPKRMVAAGRSEYMPIASNNSAEDRALNRRTRIVILPQLDEFFKLMEPKK